MNLKKQMERNLRSLLKRYQAADDYNKPSLLRALKQLLEVYEKNYEAKSK